MDIQEQVIREWFFRLPKGYTEPPYTDSELMVLAETMRDLGVASDIFQIDTLARITESANNVNTSVLTEAAVTKDDLIDLIKTTELPTHVLQYIARQIDSLASESSVIKILKDKGYDDQHSKRLFDKSVEYESYNELRDYLSAPEKAISFAQLGTSGNLNSILSKTKLSDNYLEWLFLYKPTIGGVASGNAENLLRVMLKGGHIPSKGDVGTDMFDVELKTSQRGSGFRFTGQSGYGTGLEVSSFMFNAIAELYGEDLPDDFPDLGTNDTRIQLYYDSNKESLMDSYVKDLINRGRINKAQVAELYAMALKRAYKTFNGDIISDVINPSIDSNAKLNTKEFFPRLAALEFKYYADAEEWAALMAVNDSRDYIVLNKTSSIDELAEIFKSRFKLYAPNTKPKATVQDSRVGLEYRG
jgi:hypothetical protein